MQSRDGRALPREGGAGTLPGARAIRTALALACLLAAPAAAAAQVGPSFPERLSLEEALAIARRANPRYLSVEGGRSLSEWDVRAAYGQLLPTLGVNSGISWQGAGQQLLGGLTQDQLGVGRTPSYWFSRYNVGLSYNLSGASLLEPTRARASRTATWAQVEAAGAQLDADVTRAYLEVLRQQEQLALSEAQLERVGFDLRLARGRAEVGQTTQLEVMQAELQVGRAEVARLQAANALETARLRLLQQMGVDVVGSGEVVLTTGFELDEPRWEHEDLYRMALDGNPLLRARRSTADASRVGVEVARSAYYPSLSFSLGLSGFARQASDSDYLIGQARAQVANQVAGCEFQNELFSRLADPLPLQDCTRFRFTDDMRRSILAANRAFPFDFTRQPASASLTVSVPVFPGFSRERQMEAARLQREEALHQVREQELALRADLAVGLASVRAAYQSALLEERNQTFADEQLRLARERFQLGAITFVELADAQTVKDQADRQRLAAVFSYHEAITGLEAVVGMRLRR